MKRFLTILLVGAMLLLLLPAAVSAAEATPGDYGWYTDNNNFSGWSVNADGTEYTVSYTGSNSQRIWREVLSDPQNFSLSLEVEILAIRAYVQILGTRLELNPSGGNGNQIYSPDYGNWFNAVGQNVTVTLARENGGALKVTYAGKDGDTVSFTKNAADGSNTNLELGVIDVGGSASFRNIVLTTEEPEVPPVDPPAGDKTPGDFGWETDNANFTGWTVNEEGTEYTVSYTGSSSKRIWKEAISDPQNFALSVEVEILAIRAYVQVLGTMLELNPSGGNGNQIYSPDYGNWFNAMGQTVTVTLKREDGGALNVTYAGKNGDIVSFTKNPADGSNLNLELGVIDVGGSATFKNIVLTTEEPVDPPVDPPAEGKTPADFEWFTDNDNYAGWTANEEGTVYTVSFSGSNSKRIWKPVITEPETFEVSVIVKITAGRAYVQVLGTMLELNPVGGNGNQIYSPDLGNWFNATGQEVTVTLKRENGGDLSVSYQGADNPRAVTFTKTPADGANDNLELGVIDSGSSAVFSGITVTLPEPPAVYTVTWVVDGVVTTEEYEEGTMPEYKGSTDKAADEAYTYTFAGWEPALAPVTEDVTYTARYIAVPIEAPVEIYTVTWDVDGVVTTEQYEEGTMPVYKGSTDKAADEDYTYTFVGWNPELSPVTCDVTYTALYEKTEIIYYFTVTWIVDGETTTEEYEESAMPEYKGSTDKAGDAYREYVFTGWDPELAPVTEDVTYTAQYEVRVKVTFSDIAENAWYYDEVYRSVELGLMNGMGDGLFSPDSTTTRAMLVTVLYRLAGSPEVHAESPFADVSAGSWYEDAVIWAAQEGITTGVTANQFAPDAPITRQQMVTFLFRYATYAGLDTQYRTSISYFPDSDQVADYAQDAVKWAVYLKLLTGSEENGSVWLKPEGQATRAQVAAILVRFLDSLG